MNSAFIFAAVEEKGGKGGFRENKERKGGGEGAGVASQSNFFEKIFVNRTQPSIPLARKSVVPPLDHQRDASRNVEDFPRQERDSAQLDIGEVSLARCQFLTCLAKTK